MFHNLKYLTVIVVLALPLAADAQSRRGRAPHQSTAQPQPSAPPPQTGQQAQGGQLRHGGQQQRHGGQPPHAGQQPPPVQHLPQKFRSPRAEALAPPAQLAQVLLPAGARRVNERVLPPQQGLNPWLQPQRPSKHRRWFKNYPYGSYYAVPYGGYSYYETAPQGEPAPPPPAAAMTNKGLLQLDIVPSTGLDYYIDGTYVGSSANLGSEFEVNAGARQIEIRARGYKAATFDRRIEEGQVTTVRATLEAIEQPQAPRPTGGQILYVIPGCYMGNTKPSPNALPPGCDIKKMITRGGL